MPRSETPNDTWPGAFDLPGDQETLVKTVTMDEARKAEQSAKAERLVLAAIVIVLAIGVVVGIAVMVSAGLPILQLLGFLVVGMVSLAAYFLPTLVALMRGHHNGLAIGILNFFLGWTFLGWVLALVWACTSTSSGS